MADLDAGGMLIIFLIKMTEGIVFLLDFHHFTPGCLLKDLGFWLVGKIFLG